MNDNNFIEIINKMRSNKPIFVMQALLQGIDENITDESFIEEIIQYKNNEICLLNVPIGYVATAALDVLGSEKYIGNNEYILKMIKEFKNQKSKTDK
ncbi:hypothetical protein [uncultured Catenibacterium sp.]|uniref:hypothetical protein n=1 Tax=uncultured Catenibacterium sp. TaxID=286142 RepID=UPI002593D17E|nr:hypothetical protein [uncultured Catenibacterium sp.]